jgi:ATP-dependent Clp protease ATP-binding subunit ClpA
MDIMTRHFRPEFLARVTEIVPFAPITERNVVRIFDIQLKKLLEMLNKQGVELIITDKAKRWLALSGFTPKYGARPLSAVIRNQLRRPLSRMLVAGTIGKGSHIKLDLIDEEKLEWDILQETPALVNESQKLEPQP